MIENQPIPPEFLESSAFPSQVITAYHSFFARHFEAYVADRSIDLDSYGTAEEIRIKNLMLSLFDLSQYFEDLNRLLTFFEVARHRIADFFREGLSQEAYFSYHYENFVIRIVTSIDICGKIGNILYDLKIKDWYCNWHSFAFHKAVQGSPSSEKLIECANYLEDFKKKRHAQLHWGKRAEGSFDYILTFGDVDTDSGKIHLPPETRIDALLQDKIKEIKTVVANISTYTVAFLDSMQGKLEELLARLQSNNAKD